MTKDLSPSPMNSGLQLLRLIKHFQAEKNDLDFFHLIVLTIPQEPSLQKIVCIDLNF